MPAASEITVPEAETDISLPRIKILPALLRPGGSKYGSDAAYIFPEADRATDAPNSSLKSLLLSCIQAPEVNS